MEHGDYETARQEQELDLVERALAIQAMGTVDMPVAEFGVYEIPTDPAELNICDGCQ